MTLIRAGHIEILSYGYSYAIAAKEEYEKYMKEKLKMDAFAHRIAKADKKGWDAFIGKEEPVQKKKKRTMTMEELQSINARLGRIQ